MYDASSQGLVKAVGQILRIFLGISSFSYDLLCNPVRWWHLQLRDMISYPEDHVHVCGISLSCNGLRKKSAFGHMCAAVRNVI